ncbi:MAG TPA: phage holin family protein [Anaerolineales bacterium]
MTPEQDPSSIPTWLRAVAYILFASFGGIMGHLMRTIDKKEKVVWARAALEGMAAGFVGFLFLLICTEFKLSDQWTGVIVGVSGWLGANVSIRLLENLFRKKLGIEPSQDPPNVDRP